MAQRGQKWLFGAARVSYIDHVNEGILGSLTKGDRLPNAFLPYMLKNISYEHEKEVRALLFGSADRLEVTDMMYL